MTANDMRPEDQQPSPTTDAGSGLVALHDLGVLRFEGADAAGFLQGYLTTDTAQLDGGPRFTAMCNIKGRVVCTGYAWLEDLAVTLVTHRSLHPILLDFLRPYLAFSKTSASPLPSTVVGALQWEPASPSKSTLSGGALDDARRLYSVDPAEAVEILAREPALDRRRWDDALIERREVWVQADTSGRFLPQMLGLEELGAVSFAKGCYLGQEVVARAQHRGQVKRRLSRLDWAGPAPAPGSAVEASGREVGTVLCTAGSGTSGKALAVLVRDQAGPLSAAQSSTRFHL